MTIDREGLQNNPLHGLGLEQMVTELVEHYGWDILDTAMRFNCFHTNLRLRAALNTYVKVIGLVRS